MNLSECGSILEGIVAVPTEEVSMSTSQRRAVTSPNVRRDKPPLVGNAASDAIRVVAIGASSGGLKACTTLIGALDGCKDAAFILVQHLDPTHDSMMV